MNKFASNNKHATLKIIHIFLEGTFLHKVAGLLIAKILNGGISGNIHKNSEIKIKCSAVNLYRAVQKCMQDQKVDFYTHPFQEERTLNVVKSLLPNTLKKKLKDKIMALCSRFFMFGNLATLPINSHSIWSHLHPTPPTNKSSRKTCSSIYRLKSSLTNQTPWLNIFHVLVLPL